MDACAAYRGEGEGVVGGGGGQSEGGVGETRHGSRWDMVRWWGKTRSTDEGQTKGSVVFLVIIYLSDLKGLNLHPGSVK